MSIALVVNGVTYDYPEVDDTDWGAEATDWASAVTSGMLQKAGGLFQLLAEVDFGTTYGVKSVYYKTRTSNVADAGQFRLARADVINWRNQASDGNLSLGVSASDVLQFNGSDIQGGISVTDTATINLTFAANVLSADIVTASIDNSMVAAAAAIAFSKLATLSSANILVGSAGNVATSVAVTGDVTITNAGVTAIGAAKVVNAMLANMAESTIKGRAASAGTGAPVDLTATQATAILNNFVGDSGSGGTKGLVPAPASGDAAAGKFLQAGGTWTVPAGAGDVTGPGSATDNGFVKFDGTTGKVIKNSAATITNTDVNAAAAIAYSKLNLSASIVNADVAAAAAIAVNKLAALTASRAAVTDGSGFLAAATTTATEIGYVNGVTSAIQTQINTKLPTTITTTGDIIYSSSGTTAGHLAIGASTQVLGVASGIPAWQASGLFSTTAQTTTYAIQANDAVILCSGSAFTTTLPTAVGKLGKEYTISKTDSSMTNVITLATTSSQAIGSYGTSTTLNTGGESITVISDNANWQVLNRKTDIYLGALSTTGTWSSNTTYTAVYWRFGDILKGSIKIALAGAPTSATLTVTLPSSLQIDTAKTFGDSGNENFGYGQVSITDEGTANYVGVVQIDEDAPTVIKPYSIDDATPAVTPKAITQAAPFTFATSDVILINFEVPISGWNI